MKIICFDAEFANEAGLPEEILELSVWSLEGLPGIEGETTGVSNRPHQVFHEYFRPEKHRRWPHSQPIHHITPAMVARKAPFAHWRGKVQQLVDSCDYIVGFAVENDITALQREGIKRLEDKPLVDVRDLHWLQNTRHEGVELNSRKNLATTAADLEVEFSENLAHGADYDTRKTLECFQKLIADFAQAEMAGEKDASKIMAHYSKRWEEEREAFLKEYAKGWIALVQYHDGYRLKASRMGAPEGKGVEQAIAVKARMKGMDEIDAHFDKRRSARDPKVYILTTADKKWFSAYENEYDGQEQLHRKMADLRVQAARLAGKG